MKSDAIISIAPKHPGRPTELLTERKRSESANTHPTVRPSNLGSSPATDTRCDLDAIQKMFEKCNGVLCFGSESIRAGKEDFNCEKVLAYGNCSEVKKMRHRTRHDLVMAVKVMYLSSNSEEENKLIFSDLNVVTQTNMCPFIVNCYGILFTGVEFWICMELMPTCLYRLLKDLSEPFPEHVIGKVVVSIVSALDYLKQKHNVIHRDVKPSNMLLGYRGEVKLCDFGISGKLQDSITRSASLGCIRYMAPERLKKQEYDVRADVWSLGLSILELATSTFPYRDAKSEFALMTAIIEDAAPTLPPSFSFSAEFRAFVETCLQKEVERRPKYAKLKQFKFFQFHNVKPLNVLSWLQSLKMDHLRRSFPSSALLDVVTGSAVTDSLEVNTGVIGDHDRPCATTPTPEAVETFANGSVDEKHFEIDSGGSRSDDVNVQLIAAPTVIHRRHHLDCVKVTNGIQQMELTDFLSGPSHLSDNGNCHTLNRPSAQGISCALLVTNGSSPGDKNNFHSNALKKVVFQNSINHSSVAPLAHQSIGALSSKRCRAPGVPSGVSPSRTTISQQSPVKRPHSLPRRIDPVPERSSDLNHQTTGCSSCSCTSKHVGYQPLSLSSEHPEHPNGHNAHCPHRRTKVGQADRFCIPQCVSKPKHVPDKPCARPTEHQVRSLTSQSRSASAGAQLRRSHARRWQPKQEFETFCQHFNKPNPGESPIHHQPCHLTEFDLTRDHRSITKPSSTSTNLAPQRYHHHYYYYYYQQPSTLPTIPPGPPRAMTPPLPPRGSCSCAHDCPGVNRNVQPPNPTCKNGLNPVLSGRLAHRLHTHPLPRQKGSIPNTSQLDPHTQPRTSSDSVFHAYPHASHSTNLPSSERHSPCTLRTRPTHLIDNSERVSPSDPITNDPGRLTVGPHRSSSQPANPHNWLSFETEL